MAIDPPLLLNPRGMWCPTLDSQGVAVGNVSNDLIGSNNGSLVGGVAYADNKGPCWDFDGVDGTVALDTIPSMVTASEFSIGGWFYKTSKVADDNDRLVSFVLDDDNSLHIYLAGVSRNIAVWLQRGGVNKFKAAIGQLFEFDAWHRLQLQWNDPNYAVFYDGVQLAPGGGIGGTTGSVVGARYGSRPDNNETTFFSGLMDDWRIWDRSLTPLENEELYTGGRGYVKPWLPIGGEVGAWIPTISGDNDAGDLV